MRLPSYIKALLGGKSHLMNSTQFLNSPPFPSSLGPLRERGCILIILAPLFLPRNQRKRVQFIQVIIVLRGKTMMCVVGLNPEHHAWWNRSTVPSIFSDPSLPSCPTKDEGCRQELLKSHKPTWDFSVRRISRQNL